MYTARRVFEGNGVFDEKEIFQKVGVFQENEGHENRVNDEKEIFKTKESLKRTKGRGILNHVMVERWYVGGNVRTPTTRCACCPIGLCRTARWRWRRMFSIPSSWMILKVWWYPDNW